MRAFWQPHRLALLALALGLVLWAALSMRWGWI